MTMLRSIDTIIFFLVNREAVNPFFDLLMPLLSDRGFLLALPLMALVMTGASAKGAAGRSRALGSALLICLVPLAMFFLAEGSNDLLKNYFARPRPCAGLEDVRLLVRCPRSFSLPSGHATDSFAFAISFVILSRKVLSAGWRWYLLLLAGAIAFSRVYIGVHYPSDILFGSLLGAGLAWAVCTPIEKRLLRGTGVGEVPPPRR
jgi:undecaprenyl-diphosphatase